MRFFVLVLGASLVLTGCSALTIDESDVFLPKSSVTPETFGLDDVTLHDHFLPVTDSVDVNAWHLTQPDAQATVLFFGGNGFYLVQSRGYLRALTRPSTNAFLWDYRGYGRSDGEPSVEAFRHDALAVYDHLVNDRGIDPNRLVVWGHSLGSFLATHVAEKRTVGGVVLENPATNVDGWVDHLFPWYVRLFLGVDVDPTLQAEDNVARIRSIQAPLLVVAGADDNVTDPAMAQRLYDVSGSEHKELVTVPDGGHNELYDEAAVREAYSALVARITGEETGAAAASSSASATP